VITPADPFKLDLVPVCGKKSFGTLLKKSRNLDKSKLRRYANLQNDNQENDT
jgi:hypothetical protein